MAQGCQMSLRGYRGADQGQDGGVPLSQGDGIRRTFHDNDGAVAPQGILFYYSRKHGRDFIWRVIMGEDDAAWCTSLWRHDENFMAWLEGLGLELDEALTPPEEEL